MQVYDKHLKNIGLGDIVTWINKEGKQVTGTIYKFMMQKEGNNTRFTLTVRNTTARYSHTSTFTRMNNLFFSLERVGNASI